jgi:transposase
MTKPLVSDELWAAVAPLLPEEPPKPKGGRPRCCDRRALEGIVFVLWSGVGWERLPREVFGCTGMTCWRRLRDWHAAGVLGDLHRVLLERLAAADELDWSRASIDSASIPAKGGARRRRRRSVRTPRTAAARARSGISSSTPAARRLASS